MTTEVPREVHKMNEIMRDAKTKTYTSRVYELYSLTRFAMSTIGKPACSTKILRHLERTQTKVRGEPILIDDVRTALYRLRLNKEVRVHPELQQEDEEGLIFYYSLVVKGPNTNPVERPREGVQEVNQDPIRDLGEAAYLSGLQVSETPSVESVRTPVPIEPLPSGDESQ